MSISQKSKLVFKLVNDMNFFKKGGGRGTVVNEKKLKSLTTKFKEWVLNLGMNKHWKDIEIIWKI